MKYIAKGMVVKASTEDILYVTRCGCDFQLTGVQADIWLNGRFGFEQVNDDDMLAMTALHHLKRQELVEITDESEAGEYRALTQCVIVPAKAKGIASPLDSDEKNLLTWLAKAGLRLSVAELVCLTERDIKPVASITGSENRQALTEAIYTRESIFDNLLETQMEHATTRDKVVEALLSLLKKKRIILL